MWILVLAITVTSALGDEPGPAELVRLLGSADRAERGEAARTLEELGAAALPALRAAEKTSAGETRARAASLARLIEGRQLDGPSLVAVDFHGQPLDEAIKTLAARSGYAIQLDNAGDIAMHRRSIVAHAAAPVPFWEALDQIGRAGHVRHNPGAGTWDRTRASVLHLADGEPPASTLYRGPFRVHLLGLHRRRDLDLRSRAGREPTTRGVLSVDLQAFVEPGRFLDVNGVPRFEAEDDRGHPLKSSLATTDGSRLHGLSWNVPGAIGVLQWQLPLSLPDSQAVKLRHLRGTLPVIVSATTPDPLLISLDDPPGQSYRHEDTTLRFRIIQSQARQMQIEVTLVQAAGPPGTRDALAYAVLRHRLAFEDRNGQPLSWMSLSENAVSATETQIRMMISEGEKPFRLHYHGLVWGATEVPFEFTDVPLP